MAREKVKKQNVTISISQDEAYKRSERSALALLEEGFHLGGRPCLVVSTNILNERRRTVVVVPLSSSPQASPPLLLVPVVCNGRPAVAVLDQIRAVAKERFDRPMGELSTDHMQAVEDGLRQILELD